MLFALFLICVSVSAQPMCERYTNTAPCPAGTYKLTDSPQQVFCAEVAFPLEENADTDYLISMGACPILDFSDLGPFGFVFNHECVIETVNGEIISFLLAADSGSVRFEFTACGVLSLRTGLGTRKRQVPVTILIPATGAGTLSTGASGMGDPHFASAFGDHFDFVGAPDAHGNAIFSMIDTPQLTVNMRLSKVGVDAHYMSQLGFVFRDVSFTLGIFQVFDDSVVDAINSKVAHTGAVAKLLHGSMIAIDFCHGQKITLEQLHNDQANYIDVFVDLPGCDDTFGGVLGQTWQCRYKNEPFVHDQTKEDQFRVADLKTPGQTWSAVAPCPSI